MRFIGLDIETIGDKQEYALQPYRALQGKAKISAISITDSTGGACYLSKLMPTAEEIKEALSTIAADAANWGMRPVLIGWNTPFDVAWLLAYGLEKEVRQFLWADGQVYRRALENHDRPAQGNEWGLKATVAKYIPQYKGYESEVAGNFQLVDESLLRYNFLDAMLTARLGEILWMKLEDRQRVLCNVINSAVVPFAESWLKGINIDRNNLQAWQESLSEKAFRALRDTSLDHKTIMSPQKMKAALRRMGYDVQNASRESLSTIEVKDVIAAAEYKKIKTLENKFIKSVIDSLKYNESVTTHPNARLWNTYTGRVGYTSTQNAKVEKRFKNGSVKIVNKEVPVGVPIHQWVRSKEARSVICAPEGFLLVESDFSGQESRMLACLSNDPTMIRAFREGADLHSVMAARLMNISYENFIDRLRSGDEEAKKQRYVGKVANLALGYRMSWRKLIITARVSYGLKLTEEEARRLHWLFRDTYSGIPRYWKRAIAFSRENRYAETVGGRRVLIENWTEDHLWASESTAINFPIQGSAADQKFLALGCVEPMVKSFGGRYFLDLHDALFFLIPDDANAEDRARQITKKIAQLPYKEVFGWTPQVDFPVETKLGRNWGEMVEVK